MRRPPSHNIAPAARLNRELESGADASNIVVEAEQKNHESWNQDGGQDLEGGAETQLRTQRRDQQGRGQT